MTRQNLCPNPALGATNTGWAGGSTPSAVTGLVGFPVTTGALYTSGTFQQSPTAVCTAGQAITGSAYIRAALPDAGNTLYLAFTRSAGGDVFPFTSAFSLTAGVAARVSVSGTAPALATGAYLIFDNTNAGVGNIHVTACLIEVAGSLDDYFDGESDGASWDGAQHNSTSTLDDAAEIFGVAAGSLGGLAAVAAGVRTVLGVAAAAPARPAATAAGLRTALGLAVASLGGLAVTATTGAQVAAGSTASVSARRSSTATVTGG